MASCEKCWRDAHWSGSDVATEYARLIAERKDKPCTPEEQAGEDATTCPQKPCGALGKIQQDGTAVGAVCDRPAGHEGAHGGPVTRMVWTEPEPELPKGCGSCCS